ncbi:MAG: hypothetical protein H6551_01405 [Chitinophagales bacterium]|nr:hypothetical protein [Chitinophagales bacterium]
MNKITLITSAVLLTTNVQAQTADGTPDQFKLNGNVKEVSILSGVNAVYSHLQIDPNKKEMSLNAYNNDGQVVISQNVKMNETGEVIQSEKYMAAADQNTVHTYEFENNRKKAEKLNINGESWVSKKYTYYDNGRLQQTISFDKNGVVTEVATYVYTFNKNEKTITITDGDGNLQSTLIFRYDNHDNPISRKVVSHAWGHEKNFTYSYEYDKHGNYTKCTMFLSGEKQWTQDRDITYM